MIKTQSTHTMSRPDTIALGQRPFWLLPEPHPVHQEGKKLYWNGLLDIFMAQNALKTAGGVSRLAAITTLPKRLKSNPFGCIRIGITAAGMYTGYSLKAASHIHSAVLSSQTSSAGSNSNAVMVSIKWLRNSLVM